MSRVGEGKKIRVCVVVASLDILGGQAVAAMRLLEGLAQVENIDAEILPINPRLPGVLSSLQRIKYIRTIVTFLYYVVTLLVKLRRFDVAHIFSASNLSFLLAPAPAVLIGKLYGKPVILNYHSGEAEEHLRNWRRTAIPVIKLADRVVVQSGYLVDVFSRFDIPATAIFNTVDLSQFRFGKRRPLRPIILTNRNFEKHYNVACALRAFARVQRQIPEAKLIVAGDGSQRVMLRALAEDLDLKNVEFLGAVPPTAMPALYHKADIYLNTSDVDNMPLSILEAFASGLPVVTTDAGGISYMVNDGCNGLMVKRGDDAALAKGILHLLEHHEIAEQLTNQARQDCQQYTWEAVGTNWVSLYEELCNAETTKPTKQNVSTQTARG